MEFFKSNVFVECRFQLNCSLCPSVFNKPFSSSSENLLVRAVRETYGPHTPTHAHKPQPSLLRSDVVIVPRRRLDLSDLRPWQRRTHPRCVFTSTGKPQHFSRMPKEAVHNRGRPPRVPLGCVLACRRFVQLALCFVFFVGAIQYFKRLRKRRVCSPSAVQTGRSV